MTKIKLQGGLGNQMFQYAYGRKLILHDKKKVIFDISFFKGNKNLIDTNRPFLLDKFNIDDSVQFEDRPDDTITKVVKKILSKLTCIYDFYQSETYFKDIESDIRKEFTLKVPLGHAAQAHLNEISSTTNSTSLHVRRGDYVSDEKTNVHHGACDLTYYAKAIEYIKEEVESPTFYIFSDDIEWVKENLKLENGVYVSNPEIRDYEELILMSKCSHNIIANSSFSWWGAWLNSNQKKIVIAPKQWTTRKSSDDLKILPKEWVQL